MIKKILFSLLLLSFSMGLSAQEIINFEFVRSWTKAQITSQFFVAADYPVDVYKVTYTTKNINMELDTASGSFAIAMDSGLKFPMLVYEHGTVGSRNDVPSRGSYEQTLTVAYAANGYHCLAPDYIGLGVSKGTHPYLHPESEAWATIDMIKAIKTLEGDYNVHFNEQLFVTGYSQGGHAAMATCRALQNEADIVLTAAAPMSGPYSISREMKRFTLSDNPYSFCGYLGSVFLSAKLAYPDIMEEIEVEDVFKPAYATLIRQFEAEQKGLFTINNEMVALLSSTEGVVKPKLMLKEDVRDLIIVQESHVLNMALHNMNVTDWIPEIPMKLIYCKSDDQVTYRNAIYTDSLMNANGASNVSSVDVLSSGDHSGCVFPATLQMRDFFKSFQEIESVGTVNRSLEPLNIYPNPAQGICTIVFSEDQGYKNGSIVIRDLSGKIVLKQDKNNKDMEEIDISNLTSGILILELVQDGWTIARQKLIVL